MPSFPLPLFCSAETTDGIPVLYVFQFFFFLFTVPFCHCPQSQRSSLSLMDRVSRLVTKEISSFPFLLSFFLAKSLQNTHPPTNIINCLLNIGQLLLLLLLLLLALTDPVPVSISQVLRPSSFLLLLFATISQTRTHTHTETKCGPTWAIVVVARRAQTDLQSLLSPIPFPLLRICLMTFGVVPFHLKEEEKGNLITKTEAMKHISSYPLSRSIVPCWQSVNGLGSAALVWFKSLYSRGLFFFFFICAAAAKGKK